MHMYMSVTRSARGKHSRRSRAAVAECAGRGGGCQPAGAADLGTLYKDERAPRLPNYRVLEKMFMDRLLQQDEVGAFAATLAEHQRATLDDRSTVPRGGRGGAPEI